MSDGISSCKRKDSEARVKQEGEEVPGGKLKRTESQ